MNSLIEQIETWITNLIDARIALAKPGRTLDEIALARPGNIEEISEARVMELINDQVISDDRLQDQIRTILNGSDPTDWGINLDHYLTEDSDLEGYVYTDDFMTKDDVREIIEGSAVTISVN